MEFQAIVMAGGKGSRMMEVTSVLSKCLVPVANLPLIKSCLNSVKKFGVNECIVLVPEAEKSRIQDAIENNCDLKVDIVGIPKNEDWGTADSLRHIKDKIHSDVLVISCDMVTNFDFKKMANMHRKLDSSLTMLLAPLPKNVRDVPVPGHKGKNKPEKDLIGLDDSGRLLFFSAEADFEEDEGVPIKMSIVNRNPTFHIYSNLVDAHLYMMKKSLVDYLIKNKQISSIKGEFLPVVVAKQFGKLPLIPCENNGVGDKEHNQCIDLKSLARQLSSYDDPNHNTSNCQDTLRCYAYVERDALCIRVNTLAGLMEANRQTSKNMETAMGVTNKPSIYPKSQVDNDSIVGDECQLLPKSSVKQSTIGSKCVLNEKVKISNSVVMDNISIQGGSSIQGSIVCSNVTIGSNCELKNCVVCPNQDISDGTKLNNEVIQGAYQLMEI